MEKEKIDLVYNFNGRQDYVRAVMYASLSKDIDCYNVERASFGGNIEFTNFSDLCTAFLQGSLHPQDLKNAVALHLADILKPVRRYFKTNKEGGAYCKN